MTTLLEHMLAKFLGSPRRTKGDGCSFWDCPACGHYSFRTMPTHPTYKHRAKCYGCKFRGDIYDMLAHFRPHENYGDQQRRVKELEIELAKSGVILSPGGRGVPRRPNVPSRIFHPKLVCRVYELRYDFAHRRGTLYFPANNCCDMGGAIQMFSAIDPGVEVIETYAGRRLDTTYRLSEDGWQAIPH